MKKWIVFILSVMFCLSLTGCLSNESNVDYDDEQMDLVALYEDMVLMNKFFGLTLTTPKGWYVVSVDLDNMNDDGASTEKESDLALYYDEYENFYYLDLGVFFNLKDEASLNHIEIDVFAEKYYDDFTFDEYAQSIIDYAQKPEGENPDEFLAKKSVNINGVNYKVLNFQSSREESRYLTDYYICERQGYYFCFVFIYWLDNISAEESITSYMKNYVAWK